MGNTTDLSNDLASVTSNLSYAMAGYLSIAKRIEQKFKDLEEKERSLLQLELSVSLKNEALDGREKRCQMKERELSQKQKEFALKEKLWVSIEKRMELNSSKVKTKVKLNVGGQQFLTSKATLVQSKDSLFESLFSSDQIQHDDDGEYFIDHDPKYFPIILNFMRDGKIRQSDIKSTDMVDLKDEFEYFNIPFPFSSLLQTPNEEPHNTTPPTTHRFEGSDLSYVLKQPPPSQTPMMDSPLVGMHTSHEFHQQTKPIPTPPCSPSPTPLGALATKNMARVRPIQGRSRGIPVQQRPQEVLGKKAPRGGSQWVPKNDSSSGFDEE